MKHLLSLPRLKKISLGFLMAAVIIISDTGCAPKPGCGSKHDHRVRKRRVHKFAPSMGYIETTKIENTYCC